MGMLKWIARRGAVGGTARWAAKGYKHCRSQWPPSTTDADIFKILLEHRFKTLPNESELRLARSALPEVQGLQDFVILLLRVEAGLYENDVKTIMLFIEVLTEELRKKGIADDVIFGE